MLFCGSLPALLYFIRGGKKGLDTLDILHAEDKQLSRTQAKVDSDVPLACFFCFFFVGVGHFLTSVCFVLFQGRRPRSGVAPIRLSL